MPEVTLFIAGMGVQRYMKEHKPGVSVSIVGLEPVVKSKIQGLRNMDAYVPSIYHQKLLDDRIMPDNDEAFRVARKVAQIEGLFVGISAGAAMWGAMQVANRIKEGT